MKTFLPAVALLLIPLASTAQTTPPSPVAAPANPLVSVPALAPLTRSRTSELAAVVSRYTTDLGSINRRYDGPDSPDRRQRMRQFFASWRTRLAELDFNGLSQEGKVDYVLLDNELVYQLALLDRRDKQRAETAVLLRLRRPAPGPARCPSEPRRRRSSRRSPYPEPGLEAGGQPAGLGRIESRRPAGEPDRGEPGGRGSRPDPRGDDRLVPVLRRLRPPVHLVGQGSLEPARPGPNPLRPDHPGADRGSSPGAPGRRRAGWASGAGRAPRRGGHRSHHRRPDRRGGPRRRSPPRDDRLHPGRADRDRRTGNTPSASPRAKKAAARDGLRRRLEGRDGEGEGRPTSSPASSPP